AWPCPSPAGSTAPCPSRNCAAPRTSTTSPTPPLKLGSAITFAANLKGVAMSDDVLPLLKVHEYFQGASDEALHEVVQHGRLSHHAAGSVVHEANVLLSNVCFVLRGRLKAVRIDARGGEALFRMIERGDQFGMLVGALSEPVP